MRPHALLALTLATFGTSCLDPVHSDRVDALGPEAAGTGPGPTHRPGQPCTTCHGGDGPGSPEFAFAGTVYATRTGTGPASGVDVVFTTANGRTFTARTNEVGNFYVPRTDFDVPLPVHVKLVSGSVTNEMTTRIGGNGGCAFCHRDPAGATQMPHVYLVDQ